MGFWVFAVLWVFGGSAALVESKARQTSAIEKRGEWGLLGLWGIWGVWGIWGA